MLHKRFIFRQLTRSKNQAVVFLLCVALSIVTLVALNGFSDSVQKSMLTDARRLHAADIIVHSHYELSEAIVESIGALESQGSIKSARVFEFDSMVRSERGAQSLLADIKVIDPGYPFYGTVELKSGRSLHEVLTPGNIVVEQALLDRLQLPVGDRLRVGDATLAIRDVVLQEPDRPVNFFSLGPRIFVTAADLHSLGLVTKGSRVAHDILIKARAPSEVNGIAAQLSSVARSDQERVETFRTASSRVKKFFDNLLFFLNLIGIFTLLLAGIGIQSAVSSFLKEQETTIGVMKALGAKSRFIATHFILILLVLGSLGTFAGLGGGYLLQIFLPRIFEGFLPSTVVISISGNAVMKGLLLGLLVVILFTLRPLHELKDLKPSIIFRKEQPRSTRGIAYVVVSGAILLCLTGMVWWQLEDVRVGIYFLLAVFLLTSLTSVLTQGLLQILKRYPLPTLPARQAIKGLFRPRNSTKLIITTLTISLAVIFVITLLEQNLDATFIQSYPADAPNVFFLDIQPSQLGDFTRALGIEAEYYPVVRARISSINGKPINMNKERQRRGDNLAREFNLTYRDHLLKDEQIIQGKSLHDNDQKDIQVSVLDTFADDNGIKKGDEIAFNIQGVPIRARVSSIRGRTEHFIQPFFYFVLPEHVLKDAPQTIFAALRVDNPQTASVHPEKPPISPPGLSHQGRADSRVSGRGLAKIQARMVSQFPNVSVIDVTQTVMVLAKVMHKLSGIVRFFALFSAIAGILIIISSVLATRSARIQQAVYYKVLGARGSFVLQVFMLENIILGLVSALLALAISQVGSWIISRVVFDIPYHFFWGASLVMIILTLLIVVVVGWLASIRILKQKPVVFLREQTEG